MAPIWQFRRALCRLHFVNDLPDRALSENCDSGGSGGARTRNLCRDRAAL